MQNENFWDKGLKTYWNEHLQKNQGEESKSPSRSARVAKYVTARAVRQLSAVSPASLGAVGCEHLKLLSSTSSMP